MKTVVVYGFEGLFTGNPEYEYETPELGARHKCMLFVAQDSEEGQYERALSECAKYGFSEVAFSGCGALQVEVLSTDQYRGFAGFYEEALEMGNALVYYPNA